MTRRIDELQEDRALRDMARGLVQANLTQLRSMFEVHGNMDRLVHRASNEARDLAENTGKVASRHKGAIAIAATAITLWFARDHIASLFSKAKMAGDNAGDNDSDHQENIDDSEGNHAVTDMENAA